MYKYVKVIMDICVAFLAVLVLSPVLIILLVLVLLDGSGGAFYCQERVGKNFKVFRIIKFRTMIPGSDRSGRLTVGAKDTRITKTGHFLRKFKLDELPQLFNILKGDMSLVGPRPEVPEYVALYNEKQRKVLDVKPGLTEYASIEYVDENELLGQSDDPEKTYIGEIMPAKLALNTYYINRMSLGTDMKILGLTLKKIFIRN